MWKKEQKSAQREHHHFRSAPRGGPCGICGNEDAVIVAFEMAPISVRIAGLSLKKAEKGRHLGRGPMMILSENGKVVEEPIKKSFLSALNFI